MSTVGRRPRTPSTRGYLLSHSVGLLDPATPEHFQNAYFGVWANDPAHCWKHWLRQATEFRAAIAALLGSDFSQVCPQSNLSSGLTKILGGLPQTDQRRQLLLSEDAFPSMGFVAEHAKALGFDMRLIPRDQAIQDPDTWTRYLNNEVAVCLITHVHSNTGQRLPVEEITAACRAAGAISIVDVAQSLGVVPVEPAAWDCDYIVGSCVKWLCGGPGAGFLWASQEQISNAKPLDVGWFSHADPFEFDIKQFRYANDALRFWGGTPSIAPLVIATHAIQSLYARGLDTVCSHNQRLTQVIVDALPPGARVSPAIAEDRGGTCVVHFGERQAEFSSALLATGIKFDERDAGIRLSPHFYTEDDDITTLIEAMPRQPVSAMSKQTRG